MLFNSYTFIIFFIIALLFHYSSLSWNTKKIILVIESYIFYSAWNPPFVLLLLFTTFSDWILANLISKAEVRSRRKSLLILSLTLSLGLLGFFKYGNFFLENFVNILNSIGIEFNPARPDIVLPVGISFYTFHTLSYVIDIYLKKYKPWPAFVDYALYVSFFPQLVAGPILRAPDFLPQCTNERRATSRQFEFGIALIVIGLFEKIVLADGIFAPVAEILFSSNGVVDVYSSWIGTFAFAGQIFTDFAGYSTCAIGTALCLGFEVKLNFRFPYASVGFSDFWKRWHISLSTFLRDYLYIQLGGNRNGNLRTYFNLMITMLLGGLWHGASWTFVVWGGLHGLYLVFERRFKGFALSGWSIWTTKLGQIFLILITFIAVNFAWVFFRANTFDTAFSVIKSMFGLSNYAGTFIPLWQLVLIVVFTIIMLCIHYYMKDKTIEMVYHKMHWFTRSFVLALCILFIVILSGEDRAFIYFQF